MRSVLALQVILLGTLACSSAPMRPVATKAADPPAYPAAPEPRTLPRMTVKPAPKPLFEPLKLSKVKPRLNLPTQVNIKDGSVMTHIPSGSYLASALPPSPAESQAVPAALKSFSLPDFYIDQYEITVEQYRKFDPAYDEKTFTDGRECPQCPAMGIDWMNAYRYCLWAGKRLPTEVEWEAAARGNTSRSLPWGDTPDPRRANLAGEADGFNGPAPVGSFPLGASPFGVLDMIGNVWEWVGTPDARAPSPGGNVSAQSGATGIVKGGGWRSPPSMATLATRNPVNPAMKNPTFGFRCARSAY